MFVTDSEKITFPNGRGHQLAGRLERPTETPLAWAIFAHCFTCSKDVVAASRISRDLAAHGVAVLRFDFTGLGNSQGDFANESFSSNVEDLVAAADHLRSHHEAPSLLVGHSLGGAAVLVAAGRIPEVKGVATIGAPSDPEHLKEILGKDLAKIEADGEADVSIAGRVFRIRGQFVDDLAGQNLARSIGAFSGSLLVFHAPRDEIVGIENARRIYEAAKHPKSFVSLDGADHLLSDRDDAKLVAGILAVWAERYVCRVAERRPELSEGAVRSAEAGPRYAQHIHAGRHEFVADEPASAGGRDIGPTPYDLLLAALASCTTMTIRMYADRKGWPLDRVAATVTYERIYARDCESCDTDEGRAHRMTRGITLEGDLDDEQRSRLLEIAGRCPVHRTLEEPKEILTRRAGPARGGA